MVSPQNHRLAKAIASEQEAMVNKGETVKKEEMMKANKEEKAKRDDVERFSDEAR